MRFEEQAAILAPCSCGYINRSDMRGHDPQCWTELQGAIAAALSSAYAESLEASAKVVNHLNAPDGNFHSFIRQGWYAAQSDALVAIRKLKDQP